MKKVLLLSISLLSFSAFAQLEIDRDDLFLLEQQNPDVNTSEETPHTLSLGMGFHLNSNAITNDFTKGLLYQGFIENDQKDLVSDRLKDVNRGGYDFNGGLTYRHPLNEDLSIIAGINQRQQFNAKFPKDLFELTFRGNKQYVGKHAELSPLAINFFDYQSLFLGVQKKVNSNLVIGGGLSFIRGGRFNTLKIERGTLYTAPDGTYLDFDMKFKLAFSESDNFFSSNGAGLAANWNISLLQEKSRINFEIRDLGFISWGKLKTYEGDSLFRYNGVDLNNFLDFSHSIFTEIKADSIAMDLGVKKTEKNFTFALPATFHLNYVRYISDKLTLVAGAKYMLRAAYFPRIYVKGIYYFNDKFFIAPTLAYGGFGRTDFELAAAKKFKESMIVSANVFYLEYLLLPKKTSGQGFTVSLTKLF